MKQAEKFYSAVYDCLFGNEFVDSKPGYVGRRCETSVYYDPDNHEYQAGVSGFNGWDLTEVLSNVSEDMFGDDWEDATREMFISGCIESFGEDVPTESVKRN
jgi:hypothetical protein